jgi:hypothetical protein
MITVQHPNYFHSVSASLLEHSKKLTTQQINFFSHCRLLQDGKRMDFSTNSTINTEYYSPRNKLFEIYVPEASHDKISANFIYIDGSTGDKTLEMMKSIADTTNTLSIIDKCDNYTDVFTFGLPSNIKDALNHHMSIMPVLKLYISDYLQDFKNQIHVGLQQPIIVPHNNVGEIEPYAISGILSAEDHDVLDADYIGLKNIYLGGGKSVTRQEFNALYLLFSGYEPEQISRIMVVSRRHTSKLLSAACKNIGVDNNYHLLSKIRKMMMFTDTVLTAA